MDRWDYSLIHIIIMVFTVKSTEICVVSVQSVDLLKAKYSINLLAIAIFDHEKCLRSLFYKDKSRQQVLDKSYLMLISSYLLMAVKVDITDRQ